MVLKELLDRWKSILTFITAIVVATVSIIAYAENTKEQAVVMMQAQEAIIHNDYYQNNRIERKEIEIKENQRQLNSVLLDIGDDEPTPRQSREIDYLDKEIARLRSEIEQIRVDLAKANE